MAGFKKAKREQVWLKVLLSGSSGCGKSYSALRLAKGIASKCGSDIAYIGTEGSRDLYYANEFDYDLIQLEDPFTIDKYLEAINEAVKAGYKVLIIDSLTHEWTWLNDTHDKMPGDSWLNWSKLKPKHRQFMEAILRAPIHIIATARGKDVWDRIDQNGKKVPVKVGVGAQQDKDIGFEYTVSLIIEQTTHIASADKDNTHLFEGRYEVLTEADGERLYAWANDGEVPATPRPMPKFDTAEIDNEAKLKAIKANIIALCNELGGTKNKELMSTLKKYIASGNPNGIKDLATAETCYHELQNIPPIEQ